MNFDLEIRKLKLQVQQLQAEIAQLKSVEGGAEGVAAADAVQANLDAHMAENVTDDGGVHGLRIESGSFTPYITGSTGMGTFAPTYTGQSGWYVKINNLVKFGLRLTVSSFTGDVTGTFRIAGLPFVPNVRVGLLVSHVANMTSDPSVLSAVTISGQPLIALGKPKKDQGVDVFTVLDMGTNFDITITGIYRV